MNGIIGTASLLEQTRLSSEQNELVHIITSSGHSLVHLINDVLDFSKLESEKMILENRPFDLIDLIEETIELFCYQAAERNIDLMYHVEQQTPSCIYGDRERLKQVLVNLIGNAVKFTPEGEIIISARLDTVSHEKPCQTGVTSRRRDSGIGIAAENLEKFSKPSIRPTPRQLANSVALAWFYRSAGRSVTLWVEIWSRKVNSKLGPNSGWNSPSAKCPQQGTVRPQDRVANRAPLKGKKVVLLCKNRTFSELLQYNCQVWEMEAHISPEYSETLVDQIIAYRPDVLIFDLRGAGSDKNAQTLLQRAYAAKIPTIMLKHVGEKTKINDDRLPDTISSVYKPLSVTKLFESLIYSVTYRAKAHHALEDSSGEGANQIGDFKKPQNQKTLATECFAENTRPKF